MSRMCDNSMALLGVSTRERIATPTYCVRGNTFSDGVTGGLGHQRSDQLVHAMLVEVLQEE